jgi:hypothetical protein
MDFEYEIHDEPLLNSTNNFHVVYQREYEDSEEKYDPYFLSTYTIFRNIPFSYKKLQSILNKRKSLKIICDAEYDKKASIKGSNFTGRSRIAVIYDDEYYLTYEDVFGDSARGDTSFYSEYGQNHDFMLKYDFRAYCRTLHKNVDNKRKVW